MVSKAKEIGKKRTWRVKERAPTFQTFEKKGNLTTKTVANQLRRKMDLKKARSTARVAFSKGKGVGWSKSKMKITPGWAR